MTARGLGSGAPAAALAALAAPQPAPATTRSVAPGGVDRGDCIDATCASLAYAYQQADPADDIQLAAGRYPIQHVPAGTKPVTVRGLPGNQLLQLDNRADNVTFDGLDVDAGGATTRNAAVFE